jgi:cytochrome c55X
MKRLLVPILLLLAFPAWASEPSPQRQQQLSALLDQDCGSCHGLTRKGGLGSPLTMDAMRELGDEALVATILDGRPGTPMPPWKLMLSEADARWLVRRLKGETP